MIDLHVHTTISDGIYTPDELIQRAIEERIKVLCITDHNAVNENLEKLRKKYPQITLPTGCEFSCQYKTIKGRVTQIHMGGIGFDMFDKDIQRILYHNQNSMRPYVERVLFKLKTECGIDLCSYDELRARSRSVTVGRKHVAVEMVRQGFAKNVDDAFDNYLGKNKPAFVTNAAFYAPLSDVASAVTGSGGIASICHLFDYKLDSDETNELLSYFKKITHNQGAIEVFYSSYTEDQKEVLKLMALNYGLLPSAGSDYHGDGKVTELGHYPYEIFAEMLKNLKMADNY